MKAEMRASRELNLGAFPGLQLRDLARFSKLAGSFNCSVTLCHGDRRADAKNFMDLSALHLGQSGTLSLHTWGPEAPECLEALSRLLRRHRAPEMMSFQA